MREAACSLRFSVDINEITHWLACITHRCINTNGLRVLVFGDA